MKGQENRKPGDKRFLRGHILIFVERQITSVNYAKINVYDYEILANEILEGVGKWRTD